MQGSDKTLGNTDYRRAAIGRGRVSVFGWWQCPSASGANSADGWLVLLVLVLELQWVRALIGDVKGRPGGLN
jgi:hypothetical protein